MRSTGCPLPHVPGASRHWLDSRERPHVIIPGATGRTHILTAGDFGKTIKVGVSYSDGDGFLQGAVYSEATAEVANPPPQRKRSRWTTPTCCRLPMTYIRPAQRRTPQPFRGSPSDTPANTNCYAKRTEPTNGSAYRAHSTTCRAEPRANSGPPNWTKSRTFTLRFVLDLQPDLAPLPSDNSPLWAAEQALTSGFSR